MLLPHFLVLSWGDLRLARAAAEPPSGHESRASLSLVLNAPSSATLCSAMLPDIPVHCCHPIQSNPARAISMPTLLIPRKVCDANYAQLIGKQGRYPHSSSDRSDRSVHA